MEAGMSALGAFESPVAVSGRKSPVHGGNRSRLRLVTEPAGQSVTASILPVTGGEHPRFSSIPKPSQPDAGAVPVRLTRRGRIAVAFVAAAITALVIVVVALAASGGAQAANRGQSGTPYQGMHQIVVQPGQTLWAIASSAEPSADPRMVIQQIISVNALTGTDVRVGQVLWVPR